MSSLFPTRHQQPLKKDDITKRDLGRGRVIPFPAHLEATTKTMRLGPGVTRVGTFRSADDALLRQKEGGRDTGDNRRSPLQLAELLLLQKLPQHRGLFLALSFGTFLILLLPGAGVSLLGLILDRDFNGFVRPH